MSVVNTVLTRMLAEKAEYERTERFRVCRRGEGTFEERMEYQYHRFVGGSVDDLAVEGWRFIMEARQREIIRQKNMRRRGAGFTQ